MGITIDSVFINIKKCEELLEDIIITNFFYYSLVYDEDEELDYIKKRCKELLINRIFVSDDIFENIWRKIYVKINYSNEELLYL